jgi:hypothetical protein
MMDDTDTFALPMGSVDSYGLLDRIASRFGDGLHPELRRLMHQRAEEARAYGNVSPLPSASRIAGPAAPVRSPAKAAAENANVVFFPRRATGTPARLGATAPAAFKRGTDV